MGFWFCCCWAALWTVVSADPSSGTSYIFSQTRGSFEQAKAGCHPGILTPVATEQEVQEIRDLFGSEARENLTVWVGLTKFKNECTIMVQPLKGFRWLDGTSPMSGVLKWLEEPTSTCTGVLCAALRSHFNRSEVQLGLVAVSCRDQNPFICKHTVRPSHSKTTRTPTEPGPTTRPATVKPDPLTLWPSLTTLRPGLPALRPSPPTPGSGTKPGAGSGEAPDPCQQPTIPDNRSVKLDSSTRIQVECWSNIKLDLFCSGQPRTWRMEDGSPANLSGLCQPCDPGFRKDGSGHCVDVDECRDGPCRSREDCLNTPGSFRCVCTNHTHNATCDDPEPDPDNRVLTGILVPVLVAVAVLLVLLVVVAVAVKCCLRRRGKKREEGEAEMKAKEAT